MQVALTAYKQIRLANGKIDRVRFIEAYQEVTFGSDAKVDRQEIPHIVTEIDKYLNKPLEKPVKRN
jgi:hypothetical protein